jgi:hypothetical protein
MSISSQTTPAERLWSEVRGKAPGLEGLSGKVRLHVAQTSAGVMHVDSGEVWILQQGDTETIVAFDSHELMLQLLRGEISPIVAHLQGRLRFQGDGALALKVLLGLQAGSPWSDLTTVS